MRYLVDTNIFIAVTVRNDRAAGHRLSDHWKECALSAIVLHELYAGAFESKRRAQSLDAIQALEPASPSLRRGRRPRGKGAGPSCRTCFGIRRRAVLGSPHRALFLRARCDLDFFEKARRHEGAT
jgi:hypothetical protein